MQLQFKQLQLQLTSQPQLEHKLHEDTLPVLTAITPVIVLFVSQTALADCTSIGASIPLPITVLNADPYMCTNYRPISVLSSISKIIEKLRSFQIRNYFENQFCSRTKKSTTDAINDIMGMLYRNFNFRRITQGTFLDFSNAFDIINHEILVTKLSSFYGFQSPLRS